LERILKFILLALSGVACLVYLSIACIHVFYPYSIWVLEDEIFAQAYRIKCGLPIYPPWGDSFVPIIYTPLYCYFAVLFTYIIPGIVGVRLLSALAIIGTIVISIALLKKLDTPNWIIWITCGYIATISPNLGSCWEQARVEGLMLFLVLYGGYLIAGPNVTSRTVIFSSLVLTMAYYTKQTAAPFIISIILFLLFQKRRILIPFLVLLAIMLLCFGMFFTLFSGSAFLFYTLKIPLSQKMFWSWVLEDIAPLFLRKYAVINILALAGFFLGLKRLNNGYIALMVYYYPASLAAYVLPRCKEGGFVNNYLLYGVISCIFAGWAIGRILYKYEDHAKVNGNVDRKRTVYIFLLILIMQYGLSAFDIFEKMPNRDNYRINKAYIEALKEVKGGVYFPVRSYFGYLAGKEQDGSYFGIADVIESGIVDDYPKDLEERLLNGEIKYIFIAMEDVINTRRMPERIYNRVRDMGYIIKPWGLNPNKNVFMPPIHMLEIGPEEGNTTAEKGNGV